MVSFVLQKYRCTAFHALQVMLTCQLLKVALLKVQFNLDPSQGIKWTLGF